MQGISLMLSSGEGCMGEGSELICIRTAVFRWKQIFEKCYLLKAFRCFRFFESVLSSGSLWFLYNYCCSSLTSKNWIKQETSYQLPLTRNILTGSSLKVFYYKTAFLKTKKTLLKKKNRQWSNCWGKESKYR